MRWLGIGWRGALAVWMVLAGGGCDAQVVDDGARALVPRPRFGPTVSQAVPPPPLSGGTLLVPSGARMAVAADPDRDRVWGVDLRAASLAWEIALERGDEPGRVAEDGAGRVHVALRRGGAILSLDPAQGVVLARRPVCPAPRGLVYDRARAVLHVACAGGELLTLSPSPPSGLPSAGGEPLRTLRLERDLRDVVVDGAHLLVSRFRSAELLVLDADSGRLELRLAPPIFAMPFVRGGEIFEPAVAWRMIAMPGATPDAASGGGVLMLHQRAATAPIRIGAGSYGAFDRCGGGIVHSAMTQLGGARAPGLTAPLPAAVLAVDVAISADGEAFAAVAAGNAYNPRLPTIYRGALGTYLDRTDCAAEWMNLGRVGQGQPVAVAFAAGRELVVQLREPPALALVSGAGLTTALVPLGQESREDTGHAVFHSNSGAGVACASCHAEGGDDGRTWVFDLGPRRTQSMRGGLLGSEPFHWEGDMANLDTLLASVLSGRMSGPQLSPDQGAAVARWIDRIPRLPPSPSAAPEAPAAPAAIERGRQLFHDPQVGCVTCHNGSRFSNNTTVSVGTGGLFQVPSLLGVADRAPYLHDGCASSLRARFERCGGGDLHGHTSQLGEAELADLVAYLESL